MLISGSVRSMDDLSDVREWLFRGANVNGTNGSSRNSMVDPGTTSASTTTPLHPTSSASSPTGLTIKNESSELQYYIIGVYSFFATLFAIGIIMIVARKLHKACCSSPKSDSFDYETMPRHGSVNSEEGLVAGQHPVNVDSLDVGRSHQGHDSDYDYYSDASDGETNRPKDKPPEYEEPPSYSAVLQT